MTTQNQASDSSIDVLALGLRRLLTAPAPQPDPIQYFGDDYLNWENFFRNFDVPLETETGVKNPKTLSAFCLQKICDYGLYREYGPQIEHILKPEIHTILLNVYNRRINLYGDLHFDIKIYEDHDLPRDREMILDFVKEINYYVYDIDYPEFYFELVCGRLRSRYIVDVLRVHAAYDFKCVLECLEFIANSDDQFVRDLTEEGVESNPGPCTMSHFERIIVEGNDWFEYPVLPPVVFQQMVRFIPMEKRFDFELYLDIKIVLQFVDEYSPDMLVSYASALQLAWEDVTAQRKLIVCKFPRILYWWYLKTHDVNCDPREIIKMLLLRAGVESNPGPACLNGDTKRDSKTRRSEERTKFLDLPEFHEKKQQLKHKRHVRALDAEKRAILRKRADSDFSDHEFDDFIKPEGLNIDFKVFKGMSAEIKFDLFTDLFKHLKSLLNPSRANEKVLMGHLTTLIIFLRSDDWMVRIAALVANWPNLGDKTTGIYTLLVLFDCLVSWWKRGDVNAPWYRKEDVPEEVRTQALSDIKEYFDLSQMGPVQAIGALVLSLVSLFLLNQIPGKGDFDSFMRRCDVFAKGTKGMEHIYGYSKSFMNNAVVFCEEKILGESPTLMTSIEGRLTKLCEEIRKASTIDNQNKLLTSRVQVDLVDSLFRQSLEMIETLRLGGLATQKQAFVGYFHVIRELHKKASVSPISGRGFRQQPKFYQLAGNPGVGKTRLAWILSIDFLRELNLTKEQMKDYASYIYFRKTGEKYWTNYNAEMHRVCVCDDASQLFEEHGEGVPFFAEIIHLANNAECPLNVAEVDLKKFARFNSEVIISTDNNRNPNLNNILRDPAAFRRRIDMQVEVKVKPDFGERYTDNGRTWYRLRSEFALEKSLNTDVYIFDIINPVSGRAVERDLTYAQLFERMRDGLRTNRQEFLNFGSALAAYAARDAENDVRHEPLVEDSEDEADDAPLIRVQGLTDWMWKKDPYRGMDWRHWKEDYITCNLPTMPSMSSTIEKTKKFLTDHKWEFAVGLLVVLPSLGYVIYNYMYPKRQWKRVRKHCEPLSYVDDDGQTWYEVNGVREFRYQLGWSEDQFFFALVHYAGSVFLDEDDFDHCKTKMYWPDETPYLGEDYIDDYVNLSLWYDGHFELVKDGEDVSDCYTVWSRIATENKKKKIQPQLDKLVECMREYNREDPKKAAKKMKTGKGVKEIKVEAGKGKVIKTQKLVYHGKDNLPLTEAYSDPNTSEFFKHKIFKNLYRIRVDDTDFSTAMHCTFIKGRVAVTARHLLTDTRLKKDVFIYLDNPTLAAPYRIPLKDVENFSIKDDDGRYKDLIFLVFPDNVHAHRDITSMFNTREALDNLGAVQAQLTCFDLMGTGNSTLDMISSLRFVVQGKPKTEKISARCDDDTIIHYTDYFEYIAETFPGCCGAPVMALDARLPKKILGFHVAGSSGKGYAQAISSEEVSAVLSGIRPQCLVSAPNIDSLGHEEWKPNAAFKSSGYYPLGKVNQALFTAKQTQISESPIFGLVTKPITKPANLEDFIAKDGETLVNMDFNLDKYFGPSNIYIPPEDIQILEDYGVQAFAIDDENQHLMRELTYEEAIQGIPGEEYLPSMNRQTSPGYPYVLKRKGMGKTQWLGKDGDLLVDNEELKTDVENLLCHASQGIRDPVVFTALFKDERRPIKKVDEGTTRIFAGGPMHFTVAIRMFFLGFCAAFMKQRIRNGSLVGSDVHSYDWTRFVKYLNEVSDVNEPNFLAGDHSNFDGSLILQMLWVVYRIIERLYGRTNNLTTYVLWSSICNCVLLFKTLLFMLTHSQPSGNPLTTIINTIYGRLLFFYTLLLLLRDIIKNGDDDQVEKAMVIIKNIDKYFRAGIYGDDIAAVLSHDLRGLVTPDDVTRKMATLGHKFTDELKSSGKQEFRTLHEISILKRKFVFEPTLNRWFAPLELSVILEMLNWDKCKTKYEKYEQLTQNIQTACVEFVYHGEGAFNFWTKKIRQALREANLEGKVNMPMLTYDDFLTLVTRRNLGLKSKLNNFVDDFMPW